jgi:hypothetical protein
MQNHEIRLGKAKNEGWLQRKRQPGSNGLFLSGKSDKTRNIK